MASNTHAETSSPVGAGGAVTGHVPELDGVRGASILLVLGAHMLPLGPSEWKLNAASGLMGMSLFFCLSGFLITRFLYARPELGVFLSRRIARIAPLLLLYAFIVCVLIAGRWDSFAAASLYYLNYADSAFIDGTGHLWSLCVEFHFYLAIGIAIALLGRRGFWLVPAAAVLVLVMRIESNTYYSIRTHLRVDEILSGSLLALLWIHQQSDAGRPIASVLRFSFWPALVLWFLSSHEIGGALAYLRPYFAMAVVGSILFMRENWIRWFCRTAAMRYVAKISYALYVWHPLTYMGWLGEGERWTLYLVKRPISFILTFALAHLSTHTLEAYFTRLIRNRTKTGAPTKAAARPLG